MSHKFILFLFLFFMVVAAVAAVFSTATTIILVNEFEVAITVYFSRYSIFLEKFVTRKMFLA